MTPTGVSQRATSERGGESYEPQVVSTRHPTASGSPLVAAVARSRHRGKLVIPVTVVHVGSGLSRAEPLLIRGSSHPRGANLAVCGFQMRTRAQGKHWPALVPRGHSGLRAPCCAPRGVLPSCPYSPGQRVMCQPCDGSAWGPGAVGPSGARVRSVDSQRRWA